ncbi:MAG: PDGLE domain-containing protein [Bacteroidetes bacterium]|nr:PDGLE domain-containing protein [Bacteroidota bacterium]
MKNFKKRLYIGILVLVVLTPVGIYLPELFNAEDAWGEWSTETVDENIGFVPEGMQKDADLWTAPMPDYSITEKETTFFERSGSYIISGIVGVGLSILIMFAISKVLVKHEK